MVIVPVVATLAMADPLIMPISAEAITATLAGPPGVCPTSFSAISLMNWEKPLYLRNAPKSTNTKIYVAETPAPVPKAGFFALRVVLGGLFGVLTLAALSLCNPYELLRDQHVWGARMTILSSARPREGLVQALLTLAQLFALLIGAVSTLCAAAQALGRAFSRIRPLSLWLCALGALGLLLTAAFFGMDVLLCASPLLLLPEGILLVWSFVKR